MAEHQGDGHDPLRRFVDTIGATGLASLPARIAFRWRHIHEFEDVGDDRTRVIDRVETPIPPLALRPMFAYRHRQLAEDLAAHKQAADHGLRAATVAVTGSSGLVGSALSAFLSTGGHRVIRLVRHAANDANESGTRPIPIRICSSASTRWCTWRVPRSRAGSPTSTDAQSATVESVLPAG